MSDNTKVSLLIIGTFCITVGMFLIGVHFHWADPNTPPAATIRYDTATSQITIDGCQYLWVKLSVNDKEYLSLIHKGNCTNHVALKAEQ